MCGSISTRLKHATLGELLDLRVRDGVIRRLIGKWLHAGVLERGQLSYPEERHAPRRGDFAITGEHLPALRAGLLVRGERQTAHEGANPAGAVCR